MRDGVLFLRLWAFVATLMAWLCAGAIPCALAGGSAPYGTHFIVLIDDSGDMGKFRERIVRDVPRILFGEKTPRTTLDTSAAPRFDPARDTLSIASYGLRLPEKRDSQCRNDTPNSNSLLPDNLFRWMGGGVIRSSDDLVRMFDEEMGEGDRARCRFRHLWSPISTASILAIPAAAARLPSSARYSRVVLVNVTNLVSNTNPSTEMAQFARDLKTANFEDAKALADQVQTSFYMESPPDWLLGIDEQGTITSGFSDPKERLRVVFSEAKPVESNPAALIDVPRRLVLDRVAVGPDRARVVTDDGRTPELVVRGESRFKIASLNIGGHPVTACATGCRLPLFGLLGLDGDAAAATLERVGEAGTVPVLAEFRYDATAYHNLYFPIASDRIAIIVKPIQRIGPDTVLSWAGVPVPAGPWDWWFRGHAMTSGELTGLWRSGDGALTQDQAIQRIRDERRRIQNLVMVYGAPSAAGLLAVLTIIAWIVYSRRRFRPRVCWHGVGAIELGFDAPGAAPILLGMIELLNVAPRRPGTRREEPHRIATIRAEGWAAALSVLEIDDAGGPAIGFASSEASHRLTGEVRQLISHGVMLALFLDPRSVRDFDGSPDGGPVDLRLSGLVRLTWRKARRDRVAADGLVLPIETDIRLVPESPREPCVDFEPEALPPEYRGHRVGEAPGRVSIGRFRLRSRASHRFAQPFRDRFDLRIETLDKTLPGSAAVLEPADVLVRSGDAASCRVLLLCDGDVVGNPAASDEMYHFVLNGRFSAGSTPGPHRVRLRRDGTRCDAALVIADGVDRLEIVWDAATDAVLWRRLIADDTDSPLRPLDDDVLRLAGRDVRFEDQAAPEKLFGLEIGNTGTAGRGLVTATITGALAGEDFVLQGLDIDAPERVILACENGHPVSGDVTVAEGQAPVTRSITIEAHRIRTIASGVLDMGLVSARVRVELHVSTDTGEERRRYLDIDMPLRLELLPAPNWLCIDFGTSAISVAHGHADRVEVIDLQHVRQGEGEDAFSSPSLADFDRENIERNSRSLLPSFVICDADQRLEAVSGRTLNPGFPKFGPASLTPGDPSFIGLPARMEDLRSASGRVVYSLKSWIGLSAKHVVLKDKIGVKVGGRQERRNELPLDELVQSGFAALAEAYILPGGVRPGQIVITHPNTFTVFHKERLHRNAWRALRKRFRIPREERIRLLSESDAVAYHYCQLRYRRGDRPTGRENILVYDLGAGTLDLSVITIRWAEGQLAYPQEWWTLYRLGVPVAGNHLDGILARLIDQSLRALAEAEPAMFEYAFPIVAKAPVKGHEAEHASASHSLWLAIREAKQGGGGGWDGQTPLRVTVATPTTTDPWPLKMRPQALAQRDRLEREPADGHVGLVYRGGESGTENDRLELVLPAAAVHDFEPLQQYLRFVTGDTVEEALKGAELSAEDIDTVLISGRGALWPGLGDAVRRHFPAKTDIPDLNGSDLDGGLTMKEAVVRGAIAWQGMHAEFHAPKAPKLALILMPHRVAYPVESGKTLTLDVGDNQYFRLVQVAHHDPRPNEDLGTLRRYFYTDLSAPEFRLSTHWHEDRTLIVSASETSDGGLVIRIGNRRRPDIYELRADGDAGNDAVRPPWPIGDIILPPGKE